MDIFEGYTLWLVRKGCRDATIRRRVWNLRQVFKFCPELTPETVDSYFLDLLSRKKKGSYLNSIADSVRSWAEFKGIDNLKHYQNFKVEDPLKSIMSLEEIEAFLSLPCPTCRHVSRYGTVTIRETDPEGYKMWSMFFKLCAYTGARLGEISRLTTDDFRGDDTIMILNDKIGQNRLVPLAKPISEETNLFVKTRENTVGRKLFPSNNRLGVVNSVQWNYQFHNRLKRLGIKRKGLTPYSLRHSFITSMLENDVNIFKVQKIVGHRRIDTTNKYTHMTTKDIKDAIKKLPLVLENTDPQSKLEHIKEIIKSINLESNEYMDYEYSESREGFSLHIKLKK